MINDRPIVSEFASCVSSSKKFVIRTYQRNYQWKTENLKDFVNTVTNIKTDIKKYNIGDLKFEHTELSELPVVDGQQRLITSFVLFCLFRNTYEEFKSSNDADIAKSQIRSWIGFRSPVIESDDENDNNALKIVFNNNNKYLVLNKNSPLRNNKIVKAYEFFSKLDIDIVETLYDNMTKKISVSVAETENQDESFRTFNNLNTFGLKLTGADMIAGLVYEAISEESDDMKRIIERDVEYVKSVLSEGNIKNPVYFYIRFYYLKTGKYIKQKDVSNSFKSLFEKNRGNIHNLMNDMHVLVDFENNIFTNSTTSFPSAIKRELSLSIVNTNAAMICLADELFSNICQHDISVEDKLDIFRTVEKFIVLRALSNQASTHQDFVAGFITKIINNSKKNNISILESVEGIIKENNLGCKHEGVYSSKDELIDIISSKFKIYKHRDLLNPIMRRINSYISDNEMNFDYNTVEVDHIKSQKGHEKEANLHTIGNLTLFSGRYNSICKNKPFEFKKKYYIESQIKMCEYFNDINEWNDEEILKRGKMLAEIMMDIYYI